MSRTVYSQFELGDLLLCYLLDEDTQRIGMQLIPKHLKDDIVQNRASLNDTYEVKNLGIMDCPAWNIEPLVHVFLTGDTYGDGFSQGRTLRNSSSESSLCLQNQNVQRTENTVTIDTILTIPGKMEITHSVYWIQSEPWIRIWCTVANTGEKDMCLQHLSSFSLGHITPFDNADSPHNLMIHRIMSYWSAEGKIKSEYAEELDLIPSWTGHGVRCERFGQVGSMPVRGWFPFAAIEDIKSKVLWGARLEWSGSWQMELYRRDDYMALSGGLADREYGHWLKNLKPGETFKSPSAIISTVQGNLDDLCLNLTRAQEFARPAPPEIEQELPIVFNEWCTSWGSPDHNKLIALADILKSTPVKYLVIDAGWYRQPGKYWERAQGDWIPSDSHFPKGIDFTVQEIKNRGLVPGIWFEMETIGMESDAAGKTDLQLHRDGIPITSGSRRFWDFRNPEAVSYLQEKVVNFIKRTGFGYLKVDYNETIGIGADGAESLGEGLRQHVSAVHEFWKKIRKEIPYLVIENCSSGGHRLEPVMIGLSSMSCFSDAHEGLEIPVIAANVTRMVLPKKSQVWAVLRKGDSQKRLRYSIAATFLGRMCVSGDMCDLNPDQRDVILAGMELYKRVSPIIKDGKNIIYRTDNSNYRHLTGWQCVVRKKNDSQELLIVLHTFLNCPEVLEIPMPYSEGIIVDRFAEKSLLAKMDSGILRLKNLQDYTGSVIQVSSS